MLLCYAMLTNLYYLQGLILSSSTRPMSRTQEDSRRGGTQHAEGIRRRMMISSISRAFSSDSIISSLVPSFGGSSNFLENSSVFADHDLILFATQSQLSTDKGSSRIDSADNFITISAPVYYSILLFI